MTTTGSHGVPTRRQKRMGPAPFASFEDLSDEVRAQVDSPEEKIDAGSVVRLPGIREDVTPNTPASQGRASPEFVYTGISLVGAGGAMSLAPQAPKSCLQTPNTPRIDISRASSSSQHEDSRDSTPERELFEGHDPARAKLGLGFREEGALDLRSSTEELDFQEGKQRTAKVVEEPISNHQRKDSQTSEMGMLSISGRTSRLSSIGSQGSTHSRMSNTSHLSVISGQSGLSRSPSPHKMLLETSFCGTKGNEGDRKVDQKQGTKQEPDDLEKILLARKHDPTKAILAEGISVSPKIQLPDKPTRKEKPSITITIDKPQQSPANNKNNKAKLPRTIISSSGIEYTYIPLKGPLPEDPPGVQQQKSRDIKTAPTQKTKSQPKTKLQQDRPITSPTTLPTDNPKYIRIKLKPDHLYDEKEDPSLQKPDTLDLNNTNAPSVPEPIRTERLTKPEAGRSISSTPSASPKFSRHILKEPFGSSKSPSPSLSRKSSFASLFRSKEAIISPESPTVPTRRKSTLSGIIKDASENLRERRRSRSKSRDRDKNSLSLAPSSTESIDSKGKKNVFSIFKGKKQAEKVKDTDDIMGIGSLSNVEFKFRPERCEMPGKYHETPLEGDSIRIPLHSPTFYEQKAFLQDLRSSSQGSQETVIENVINKDENKENNKSIEETPIVEATKKIEELRQNSTSSENVVFSTRLGSTNELFTTKLPKQKIEEVPIETFAMENTIIETSDKIESELQTETIEGMLGVELKEEEKKDENQKPIDQGAKKRVSKIVNDEEHFSSESERDSEIDFKPPEDQKVETVEIERKGLVMLQDSFEDELPYVPTTLPQERSVAVPIVPVKQRGTYEMKVCPIERPRSTTPINPSCLEDYCEDIAENVTRTIEKLKISLPREDSIKYPRRPSNTNWADFAERKFHRRLSQEAEVAPPPPPPLPPKGVQREWINFEEIPERRKPPKRIQTIPSRGNIEVPESVLHDNVVYSYVNPEDCKCECHEINARAKSKENQRREPPDPVVQEDELPLLQDEQAEEERPLVHESVERIKLDVTILDRRSVISDSSVDLSTSVDHPVEANGVDCLRLPFTSDLGVSSNRSSVVSQDETQTPEGSPNAFPKTS